MVQPIGGVSTLVPDRPQAAEQRRTNAQQPQQSGSSSPRASDQVTLGSQAQQVTGQQQASEAQNDVGGAVRSAADAGQQGQADRGSRLDDVA